MKCLVTKLNGVVQNELIPKIGEKIIHFSKTRNSFSFANSDSTTLKLIGDECYFTDSTYSQNYGKNSEVDAYDGIVLKKFNFKRSDERLNRISEKKNDIKRYSRRSGNTKKKSAKRFLGPETLNASFLLFTKPFVNFTLFMR